MLSEKTFSMVYYMYYKVTRVTETLGSGTLSMACYSTVASLVCGNSVLWDLPAKASTYRTCTSKYTAV